MRYAVLTHGGAASPHAFSDGCLTAAEAGRAVLERGGDALAAALAATVVLEDDERFNAGTGSNLRLDGKTIEMDAAVMTSDARFGAVACISDVKNPVLVAARVIDTPHLMLAGEGATAFARRLGFPPHDATTERAREKHARAVAELRGAGEGAYLVDAMPWRKRAPETFWNFPSEPPWTTSSGETPAAPTRGAARARAAADATEAADKEEGARGRKQAPPSGDTVGAVVRDTHGRFAATASTGGTLYMLKGRVGDSPLIGCGVYAGPSGAVAATGVGEEIIRRFLAKTVYDWLAEGMAPARAAQRGLAMFPDIVDIGLLVVGRDGQAIASNRNMASATIVG